MRLNFRICLVIHHPTLRLNFTKENILESLFEVSQVERYRKESRHRKKSKDTEKSRKIQTKVERYRQNSRLEDLRDTNYKS